MEKISIVKRRKADDSNTEKNAANSFRKVIEQKPVENNAGTVNAYELHDYPLKNKSDSQDINISGNNPYEIEIKKMESEDGKIVLNLNFASMQPQRMLTSADVCMMLKISKYLLQRLVKEKEIGCYKVGKLKRFLLDDILTYIQRSKVL
ncbi:MAG: helix-turn-helix domain-containing protein [Proteobacteria bacterium]|nr:helix-turn-helix domain-containing protein [Pseudomonadota bacterium]